MMAGDHGFRLSVLLVTYNHKKYIRQALKSLFDQKIDGHIELVIADDCSSDGTLDIIKSYDGCDPRFDFKYLDSTSNLGIVKNYQRAFGACSGKYIAVLEGDDYWIHPEKLTRQLNFLENHWECALCSSNHFLYYEAEAKFKARVAVGNDHRIIGARDLIEDNVISNFSTCMYRKSALDELPVRLFDLKSYDWIVNICAARTSLIGYFDEPMSVYRLHSTGTWAKMSGIEKVQSQLDLIADYDSLTDYVFHDDFNKLTRHLSSVIAQSKIESCAEAETCVARSTPISLRDYVPPVLLLLIRAVLPPILKRFMVNLIRRSRSK